jgi:EAL domain-containing protein (putative c-di-GMP-specific phosphodiesterase class I)
LQHAGLVTEVDAILAESGLAPACLTLEITESVVMQDAEASVAMLTALKGLGVRLAVDDFGTGYSSLSYLQRFPIDVLKIDKAFVSEIGQREDGAALARTIVHLGRTLRLQTVAEGVETAEQVAALRDLGCDLGQGYHFSRPLPGEAVAALLAAAATPDEAVA